MLLTAAMAKQLGGTPGAQWLAALGVTTCGFFLAANGLMQTVSFDTLAWALASTHSFGSHGRETRSGGSGSAPRSVSGC